MSLLVAIIFSSMGLGAITSFPIALPGCSDKCGNVSVPYPFGIGRLECAKNDSFFLNCTETGRLFDTNVQVHSISLENSSYTAGFHSSYKCYNDTGYVISSSSDWLIKLQDTPLTISPTRNKLTALGCNTMGLMSVDSNTTNFESGCLSLCDNTTALRNLTTTCSGIGCCQTPIPENIKELEVWVDTPDNHSAVWNFNPCSYAFVAENNFNISTFNLSVSIDQNETNLPPHPRVVLEWVTGDDIHNCQASEDYSCGANANCSYSKLGHGSVCSCLPGFNGNPYLPQGCQDINECLYRDPCHDGTCKNINGSYTCQCPLGMHGDGKVGCKGLRLTVILAVIGVAILLGIIAILILYGYINILQYRRFIENVNKAMVDLGFRKFEEAELQNATNSYASDNLLGEGGFGSVYKGALEDGQLVAIKKSKGWKAKAKQDFINEMRIVAQVNHKHIVKILGLCLETQVPLLVYEFISNETLYFHIINEGSEILKSWKTRLRIALEIATALYYLHSSTHTPIIHGDIKSTNILLDDQNTTKVADFGASILTSQNQVEMDSRSVGTLGYLDPEYEETKKLTEKSDVYSFGVVLIELVTGKTPSSSVKVGEPERDLVKDFISAVEDHRIIQVLDDKLKDDVETKEVEAVAELAKECLNKSGEKRPTMKEVTEELESVKGHSKKTVPAPQETQETGGLAEVVELGKMESYPSVHSSSFDTEQVSIGETSP